MTRFRTLCASAAIAMATAFPAAADLSSSARVLDDGSLSILLDSLPLGTNKLQVREIKEDAARGGPGAGARARADEQFEEVRT